MATLQLYRVGGAVKIYTMKKSQKTDKDSLRAAFAKRLNALLDHYNVPAKHAGRQKVLKEALKVSQESARKWLEGESIPREERIAQIATAYPCRKAWLQNGELPMFDDPKTRELIERWESYSDREREALLALLRGYGSRNDDPSPPR